MAGKSSIVKEFKEFIMRGNVLDMAIGVVIATAFGAITTSLIQNIIMPLIGLLFGGIDLAKWDIVLKAATEDKEAVVLGIGTFLTAIINFVLIALVIFAIVKAMNKIQSMKKKEEEEVKEEEPAGPTSEELLTEIRDLLKEKK